MDLWISFGFQRFPEELQRHMRFGSFFVFGFAMQAVGPEIPEPPTLCQVGTMVKFANLSQESKLYRRQTKKTSATTLETKGNRMEQDTW